MNPEEMVPERRGKMEAINQKVKVGIFVEKFRKVIEWVNGHLIIST